MARRYIKNQAEQNSIQATALVHEVYLRLVDVTRVEWQARAQFFAIAAQMMRRILVDAARRHGCRRRDGIPVKINLDETAVLGSEPERSILALDEALTAFAEVAPRQAKVVELRYFGGLTEEEIEAVLKISPRTIRRDWDLARAWLLRELSHTKAEASGSSDMKPEHFRRLEELYHAAREATSEQRAALLAETDPELRRQIESLLQHRTGGEFLDRPAALNAPELLTPDLQNDATLTALAAGVLLGPYRIEGKLGEGGMGEVFRAVDTRLGRPVAIKITREQFSERFEREARAISSLNHPNVCTLYDVGPNYLVMELVEGETIAALLKTGPLELKTVMLWASQILAALAEAHSKGIVHRDLKPGNVMIAKSGVKVLDFGLAKSGTDDTLTGSHMAVGTPAYMAPEQREGKPADARADIYAFGCTLYEMLTGTRVGAEAAAHRTGKAGKRS